MKDEFPHEEGAHKLGPVDSALAGLQILGSPISTFKTMSGIKNGFSTTDFLSSDYLGERFPAGRAMISGGVDGFGFAELADPRRAAASGVTIRQLEGIHHNEILFAPARILALTGLVER